MKLLKKLKSLIRTRICSASGKNYSNYTATEILERYFRKNSDIKFIYPEDMSKQEYYDDIFKNLERQYDQSEIDLAFGTINQDQFDEFLANWKQKFEIYRKRYIMSLIFVTDQVIDSDYDGNKVEFA